MNIKSLGFVGTLFGVVGIGIVYLSTDVAKDDVGNSTKTVSRMVDVVLPELNDLEQQGEVNFIKYCSTCHGIAGSGQKGVAPPLIHKIYEPSHHSDISFRFAAERGVRAHHWPFGNMPPVENITLPEIQNITLYIRSVQRANGIF